MKLHVNLSLDAEIWNAFKAECDKRKIPAGQEIQKCIEKRLEKWKKEDSK